jgi:hypothetical protein
LSEDKFAEIAIGGLTIFGSLIAWLIKQERRMGRLEFRMEMIYEGWFKNVFTKIAGKELGTMNSPMRINDRGLALLAPVTADLERWYKGKESWSNVRLGEALKIEWQDRLVHDVALPKQGRLRCLRGAGVQLLAPADRTNCNCED